MRPVVRSAPRFERRIGFLSKWGLDETVFLADFHLDELAFMDGQLDGAKAELGEGLAHELNGVGIVSLPCSPAPIILAFGHICPLLG